MTNATSVKERLKNVAQKENRTMQDCLVSYALERSIYRLSVSKYASYFILKGGVFLYALFGKEFPRATIDIDLLARSFANNPQTIADAFKEIFSIEVDDALVFDLDSLTVNTITEFKEYPGVNVLIIAYLDRTRIPVSIDIGFGDIVYPDCVEMDFPVLLDMEIPKIYAYSIYSIIAEKFEAIVSLGLINSRYKDFYDIYQIAKNYNLDGNELKTAIQDTFEHRGTGFDDIVAFAPEFANDPIHIQRWNAFIKKKKAMENVSLAEVIELLKTLLEPTVISINADIPFNFVWNKLLRNWSN